MSNIEPTATVRTAISNETQPNTTHQEGELNKSAVREVYRRLAPLYDATFGILVSRYRGHVRPLVQSTDAHDVLEVGVGTGMSLHHYPKGTRVTGLDMCPEMLGKAQSRVDKGLDAEVELHLGDGERLDFPDHSFDLVVMMFVVSVTPDPVALLDEVARVLRPGGRVLIINHFAGVTGIGWAERLLVPLADRIGFRSRLPISTIISHHRFVPETVKPLWPIGFFNLITLQPRK
ncbi:Predicted N-methyltransferase [gamma proteobacterium HdN1]|nr:Predicted N-methyltransferase [gamma proteobacterium HdN1]